MRVNFARWNHVFIPARKEGRDRFRNSRLGRLFRPLFTIYEALTPEGHEARIDLSITDDWPLAQAFVIISAVTTGKA